MLLLLDASPDGVIDPAFSKSMTTIHCASVVQAVADNATVYPQ